MNNSGIIRLIFGNRIVIAIALSLLAGASIFLLTSCEDKSSSEGKSAGASKAPMQAVAAGAKPVAGEERWYSFSQVTSGGKLFQIHCAVCHKPDASGTANWKEVGPDGKYPPPPLNGTAHTWHHPLPILRRTVRVGGIPLGGSMPAFGDKLKDAEIDAILAWVQSHWSDEIYATWSGINTRAAK